MSKELNHLAAILHICLCRFDFYEVKEWNKKLLFQKENWNIIELLIIFLVKSLQKEQKAQIMEYKTQSAKIKSAITPKWFKPLDTNSMMDA